MRANRQLNWQGCINVRDLGGLPTRDGRRTRWGAVVRSDNPAKLTARGWTSLERYGIRTIVALRTDGVNEDEDDIVPRPKGLKTVQIAIEDFSDAEFVHRWVESNLWGTPLYFSDALKRWPERHASAVAAVVHAEPGGVLIHCGRGHDRTGIVSLLLLAVAGVAPADIAADYELSNANMPLDDQEMFKKLLASAKVSVHDAILTTLASLDVDAYLRAGGLDQETIAALRARLVETQS
ncbi:MAG: tyrosine-protein phosphatase [Anaerolineae bacterium]|nr:tyrosine-protein phosphatase [Anaerolineae bacterium]